MQHLDLQTILFIIITIIISLAVHEFMHAFIGFKLGDRTAHDEGRLTLNPLAHIDPVMTVLLPIGTLLLFGAPILAAKPVPFNPYNLKYDEFGAAMIAAAGPLSNLALAVVGALALNAVGFGNEVARNFLQIFTELNVALFVFNLIPIPPLDGSRVLYAFSPEPLRRILQDIEPYGFFIIIALVLAGGLGGFITNLNNMVLNLLP
ncbi:MAG: site-2 protease family protein [Patescibacteria group bacterium]|nr:site-2 protease family protein [Patescibacteria group bacterium]